VINHWRDQVTEDTQRQGGERLNTSRNVLCCRVCMWTDDEH